MADLHTLKNRLSELSMELKTLQYETDAMDKEAKDLIENFNSTDSPDEMVVIIAKQSELYAKKIRTNGMFLGKLIEQRKVQFNVENTSAADWF